MGPLTVRLTHDPHEPKEHREIKEVPPPRRQFMHPANARPRSMLVEARDQSSGVLWISSLRGDRDMVTAIAPQPLPSFAVKLAEAFGEHRCQLLGRCGRAVGPAREWGQPSGWTSDALTLGPA